MEVPEVTFATAALQEIPDQYHTIFSNLVAILHGFPKFLYYSLVVVLLVFLTSNEPAYRHPLFDFVHLFLTLNIFKQMRSLGLI